MKRTEDIIEELLKKTEWNDRDRRLMSELLKDADPDLVKSLMEKTPNNYQDISPEQSDRLLKKIYERAGISEKTLVIKLWPLRIAAASVIALALLGGYLIFTQKNHKATPVMVSSLNKNDIPPGGNKAILTLADGTRVILDSANNGTISKEGNVTVIKLDDGQLAYNSSTGINQQAEVQYNTITTPRGGQYQLILSDGTKVWLNAASSLRYPTSFSGKERRVELTGEGYFEVKHDPTKPFFVTSGSMNVKVLGTHFNINAYTDEDAVKTTLLQGSVEINTADQSTRLVPGDQAQIINKENDRSKIIKVKNIDTDQVIAWKNGYFSFNDNNIQSVMRQLSKWYDIDVTYNGTISNETFSGKVYRNTSLKNVLEILSFTNLHIRLQGRTLIISST